MRTFLLMLVLAVFLYSSFAPSWGREAVNIALVVGLFWFLGRAVPRRRYR
jgi:glucose uptake protein GlcU